MGLYKEENYELATLEAQQSQIYSDAADYGIAASSKSTDVTFSKIKDLIGRIKAMGFNMHRLEEEYGTGRTTKVTFYIPWELTVMGQPKMGMRCTKWVVEYVESFSKHTNYFTFYQQNENSIKELDVYEEDKYLEEDQYDPMDI